MMSSCTVSLCNITNCDPLSWGSMFGVKHFVVQNAGTGPPCVCVLQNIHIHRQEHTVVQTIANDSCMKVIKEDLKR